MKRIGWPSFVGPVVLLACGGSDNTPLSDDGGNDAMSDAPVAMDTGSDAQPADAGNDGTTNDGGGFHPGDVVGLVLWLEGDVSSSIMTTTNDASVTRVLKWQDQTSHHNDANGNMTFFTSMPTMKPSAIHALPAVHFDQNSGGSAQNPSGNMLTIPTNKDGSLDWGTGDFWVSVVGDFDNDATKTTNVAVGNFFSKATLMNGATYTGLLLYGNVPAAGNNATTGLLFATASTLGNFVSTSTAYNNGTAHLFTIRRRSGSLDLLVDGTSVANATGSTLNVTTVSPVRIGADGDANFVRLDGDIGEVMAVQGTLMASDEAGLTSYLKTKWATP